jgi:hypothetical protein
MSPFRRSIARETSGLPQQEEEIGAALAILGEDQPEEGAGDQNDQEGFLVEGWRRRVIGPLLYAHLRGVAEPTGADSLSPQKT